MGRLKERFFPQKHDREVPESRALVPDEETIKEVVCEYYGVKRDELLKSQRGRFNEPRNVAIYLTKAMRRDTLEKIANGFHMSRYSSASSAIARVKAQMRQGGPLPRRVKEVTRMLTETPRKLSMHQT